MKSMLVMIFGCEGIADQEFVPNVNHPYWQEVLQHLSEQSTENIHSDSRTRTC
jgi:hypothetical protein